MMRISSEGERMGGVYSEPEWIHLVTHLVPGLLASLPR